MKSISILFEGRLGRKDFILSLIAVCLTSVLVTLGLLLAFLMAAVISHSISAELVLLGIIIIAAIQVFTWVVIIGLDVRRLHDLGHPAILVLFLFTPIAKLFMLLYLI